MENKPNKFGRVIFKWNWWRAVSEQSLYPLELVAFYLSLLPSLCTKCSRIHASHTHFVYKRMKCRCICQPARLNRIIEWKMTNNEIQRTSMRGFVDAVYKYNPRHFHRNTLSDGSNDVWILPVILRSIANTIAFQCDFYACKN